MRVQSLNRVENIVAKGEFTHHEHLNAFASGKGLINSCLHMKFSEVEMSKLCPMLSSMCEILLQSTRELPTPKELCQTSDKVDNTFVGTDIKLKVMVIPLLFQ